MAALDDFATMNNADATALITAQGTESDAEIAKKWSKEGEKYKPTAVKCGGAVALLRFLPGNVPFIRTKSVRLIMFIFTPPECRRQGDAHRLLRILQKKFGALVAYSTNDAMNALLDGCDFTLREDYIRMYTWEKEHK